MHFKGVNIQNLLCVLYHNEKIIIVELGEGIWTLHTSCSFSGKPKTVLKNKIYKFFKKTLGTRKLAPKEARLRWNRVDGGKEKDRELEAGNKGSSGPRTASRLPAAMPGPGKDQTT